MFSKDLGKSIENNVAFCRKKFNKTQDIVYKALDSYYMLCYNVGVQIDFMWCIIARGFDLKQ